MVTIAAVGSLLAEIVVPASLQSQLQIMLYSASYLVAFLNVDFLPCVVLFISSVLAYSFLRISLVRLSMSFSWITVQSVVHMWYCRVGKAKLLVASTFLSMEILRDQITDKRLRYSLVASLQTCCSRWTEFSYLPRNLQWPPVSSILSSSVSVIETFSSFIYNLPRTMLIVAHFSNPQKSSMSSNILSAVLVISSAFSVLTCGKSLGHPRRASASAFLACCASTCTLLWFVTTRQLGSDRV